MASTLFSSPVPSPHTGRQGLTWSASLAALTVLAFSLYHLPTSLHDISHYETAGVSMVRGHRARIRPYDRRTVEATVPTYGTDQDVTIRFGERTNLPSKLHSLALGTLAASSSNRHGKISR